MTTLPIDHDLDALLAEADKDGLADNDALRGTIDDLARDDLRRTVYGLMRALYREQAAITDARAWLVTVEAEVEAVTERHRATAAFLEEQVTRLAEDLIPDGKKSVDVPGLGRIQYRDLPAGLRIADPDAFIKSLDADERARLVEMRPHLKTNDAKAYAAQVLETTGEVITGVEQVPAQRSASIQWGGR